MKRTGFALALLVFALLPYTSFAQQMYPNYSTYQTVTGSSTAITVSVTVDGSTSGNLCNQYGCISPPTHTPSVSNTLKNTTTGAVTGGWQTGPGVTWNSYLSQTNNQSVPLSTNVSFDVSAVTQIICSAVGSFFFFQFPSLQIELAYTKGKYTGTSSLLGSDGTVSCSVTNWCTPATTPPKCGLASVVQHPLIAGTRASCWAYYDTKWVWEKIGSSSPWCIPLIPGQNATGTTDASLYACTH